jgi:hypothetical protein
VRAVVVSVALPLLLPALVFAASPAPSGGTGSDTRSPGEGPGLVGAPGLAILAVLGIGVLALVITLAYVRLTEAPAGRK